MLNDTGNLPEPARCFELVMQPDYHLSDFVQRASVCTGMQPGRYAAG
jgi:hypothetical protein